MNVASRREELEQELGQVPEVPNEAERRAIEERLAGAFEAVAVSLLGERGHALGAGLRKRLFR